VVKADQAQLRVDAKTNEHKAALELLGVLPIQGKVGTGDAMFTHRDVCTTAVTRHDVGHPEETIEILSTSLGE
jgi:hypothetical protein